MAESSHSPPAARQPVIILGMHRSGTSMIAKLLDRLGLFVGAELQEDHESTFFLELNETLFSRVHACWDNPLPMRNFLAYEEAVRLTATALNGDLQSRRFRRFFKPPQSLAKFDRPWGWKDPRTVFTLPIWLRMFPQARLIYIVRNGVDVAGSLVVRERNLLKKRLDQFEARMAKRSLRPLLDRVAYKGSARCLTLDGAFELWIEYLRQADENLSGISSPLQSIRFEDFVAEPRKHLKTLAEFCELPRVTEEAIARAAEEVRPGRSMAFASDPVLATFHRRIRENPWMERYGY